MAAELPPELLAVRHIGPRRARRLIDALGADWRAWVDLAPKWVFGTLRGVGPRRAAEAAQMERSSQCRSVHLATGHDYRRLGVNALLLSSIAAAAVGRVAPQTRVTGPAAPAAPGGV